MSHIKHIEITPVMDTNAYAQGDVLFIPTKVPNVFANRWDGTGVRPAARLLSMIVYDLDNQTAYDFDLYFTNSQVTTAAANAAFAGLSDADVLALQAHLLADASAVAVDMTNSQVYLMNHPVNASGTLLNQSHLHKYMHPVADSADMWLFAVLNSASTPTHTASGVRVHMTFEVYE